MINREGNKFDCISVKVLNILMILISFVFTTFQFYYCDDKFTLLNVSVLIFFSLVIFWIGWKGLLTTNHPLNKYNLFTLNPKYKGTREKSFDEDPVNFFKMDELSEKETITYNRDKKLNKLLK